MAYDDQTDTGTENKIHPEQGTSPVGVWPAHESDAANTFEAGRYMHRWSGRDLLV